MLAPGRLAEQKEDDDMAQRFHRSIVTAAVLATALSLAGPVEAGGWSSTSGSQGFLEKALGWVQAAWEMVVPTAGREGTGVRQETERSVVPDGGTTSGTTCTVGCDRGGGIDPNG
jgi:roadblock/LC7 domain-containing protein